jgi:hypothetical protein
MCNMCSLITFTNHKFHPSWIFQTYIWKHYPVFWGESNLVVIFWVYIFFPFFMSDKFAILYAHYRKKMWHERHSRLEMLIANRQPNSQSQQYARNPIIIINTSITQLFIWLSKYFCQKKIWLSKYSFVPISKHPFDFIFVHKCKILFKLLAAFIIFS